MQMEAIDRYAEDLIRRLGENATLKDAAGTYYDYMSVLDITGVGYYFIFVMLDVAERHAAEYCPDTASSPTGRQIEALSRNMQGWICRAVPVLYLSGRKAAHFVAALDLCCRYAGEVMEAEARLEKALLDSCDCGKCSAKKTAMDMMD